MNKKDICNYLGRVWNPPLEQLIKQLINNNSLKLASNSIIFLLLEAEIIKEVCNEVQKRLLDKVVEDK